MSTTIRIGTSTCGLAAGAEAVYDALRYAVGQRNQPTTIQRTGCLGACHREPLVEVIADGTATLYGPVRPAWARALVDGQADPAWVVSRRADRADYPFLGRQCKVTTERCGKIDPLSLDEYLADDGYQALKAALAMPPEQVIQAIVDARLRGRGGAGYPTGKKWALARAASGRPKYIICNADEGDPGAFMDRTMIEGDPHRLLEGMLIAGWAIGATTGYLYVRAEYPLAVEMLRRAIQQAAEHGLTGRNILGSGFDFEFVIKQGAGAFVCGEETALMRSIEGHRGTPTLRPPYPAEVGLWGCPTNINNVETYASVPSIILNGPGWFAGLGTARSGGTKAFALTGAVRQAGLVEVPIGMSLRELIFDIAGGCARGRHFKAVQLGGPSGGCVPEALLDTPIDYEDLKATGAIMGSGGMVVVDDTTCMVDFARYFLQFTRTESCGKCAPCRVGTRQLLHMLTEITRGRADQALLAQMQQLCHTVQTASLCGLGRTAPNPLLTTLQYFADEYRAHVDAHRCPAGVCRMAEPSADAPATMAAPDQREVPV